MLCAGLVIGALLIGIGLGYGFRGKEHAALAAAGAELKDFEARVKEKL